MTVLVLGLGTGSSRAEAEGPPESLPPEGLSTAPRFETGPTGPYAKRFPNLVLRTHEGRNVRFYDDLLKDKIVLINFMYASCVDR